MATQEELLQQTQVFRDEAEGFSQQASVEKTLAQAARSDAQLAKTNADNAASASAQSAVDSTYQKDLTIEARDLTISARNETISARSVVLTKADEVAANATTALAASSQASSHVIKASQWADYPRDQIVPGESSYSARHWAEAAAEAASGITGDIIFLGPWDAAVDGTPPTPSQSVRYLIVSDGIVDGKQVFDGDYIIYDVASSGWLVTSNANRIASVNGYESGNVVLDFGDFAGSVDGVFETSVGLKGKKASDGNSHHLIRSIGDKAAVGALGFDGLQLNSGTVPQWYDGTNYQGILHTGGGQTIAGDLTVNGRVLASRFNHGYELTDFDSSEFSGFYFAYNGNSNMPGGGSNSASMLRVNQQNQNNAFEIAGVNSQNQLFFRNESGGVYGSWKEILHTEGGQTINNTTTFDGHVHIKNHVAGAGQVPLLVSHAADDANNTPAMIVAGDGEATDILAEFRANATGTSVDLSLAANSADAKVRIFGNGDVHATGTITASGSFIENGTSLSAKYLGINAKASSSSDSDKLGNVDAANFVYGTAVTGSSQVNDGTLGWNSTSNRSGFYSGNAQPNDPSGTATGWYWGLHASHVHGNGYGWQLVSSNGSEPSWYLRGQASDVFGNWHRVLHEDINPTLTGNWEFTKTPTVNGEKVLTESNSQLFVGSNYIIFQSADAGNNDYIAYNDTTNAFYFNADTTIGNASGNAPVYAGQFLVNPDATRMSFGGGNTYNVVDYRIHSDGTDNVPTVYVDQNLFTNDTLWKIRRHVTGASFANLVEVKKSGDIVLNGTDTVLHSGGGTIVGDQFAQSPTWFDSAAQRNVGIFGKTFNVASYLDAGEWMEIARLLPSGNSRNYWLAGELFYGASADSSCIRFIWSVRSNTMPSTSVRLESWRITENQSGVKLAIWKDDVTGESRLMIKKESGGGIHNLTCTLQIHQRGNYDDYDFSQRGEFTAVEAGFVETVYTPREYVDNTTAQTIAGDKTFTGTTTAGDLYVSHIFSNDFSGANKQVLHPQGTNLYVGNQDHQLRLESNAVPIFHIAGAQHAAIHSGGGQTIGPQTEFSSPDYTALLKLTRESTTNHTWQFAVSTDGTMDISRSSGAGTARLDVPAISSSGDISATGAVTGSNLNVSNWNTAYGWGNHSGLYLPMAGGTLTGGLSLGANWLTGVYAITLQNIEKTNLTADGQLGFDASQGLLVYRAQQGVTGVVTVLDGANVDAGDGINITNTGLGGTGTEPFTFTFDTTWGDARYMTLSGTSTTTGQKVFTTDAGAQIASVASGAGMIEVRQNTASADALMRFHVAGDYAAYFGLSGGLNDFVVGGYSMGATEYRVFHSGNRSTALFAQIPDESDELPGSQNLDNLTTPGFYHQTANADASSGTNYPAAYAGSMIVLPSAGTTQMYITYNGAGGPDMYLRNSYGSWSGWKKTVMEASNGDVSVAGNFNANGTYISGDGKNIVQYSDGWLRLNPSGSFGSGIYCGGTGTLRHDGSLQVGNGGSSFLANSSGVSIGSGTLNVSTTNEVAINMNSANGRNIRVLSNQTPNTGFYSVTNGAWLFRIDGSNNAFFPGNATFYYSDERLKDVHGRVENALDAVMSWEPIRYRANQLANKLAGFDTEEDQIGLRAQQVQKTHPEVVKRAPFDIDADNGGGSISGDDYLTLQYDRLVPVLVAAIQELKAEINELRGNMR